nr:hypothetical protein [Tanacetum cinerariifolium]
AVGGDSVKVMYVGGWGGDDGGSGLVAATGWKSPGAAPNKL